MELAGIDKAPIIHFEDVTGDVLQAKAGIVLSGQDGVISRLDRIDIVIQEDTRTLIGAIGGQFHLLGGCVCEAEKGITCLSYTEKSGGKWS